MNDWGREGADRMSVSRFTVPNMAPWIQVTFYFDM